MPHYQHIGKVPHFFMVWVSKDGEVKSKILYRKSRAILRYALACKVRLINLHTGEIMFDNMDLHAAGKVTLTDLPLYKMAQAWLRNYESGRSLQGKLKRLRSKRHDARKRYKHFKAKLYTIEVEIIEAEKKLKKYQTRVDRANAKRS